MIKRGRLLGLLLVTCLLGASAQRYRSDAPSGFVPHTVSFWQQQLASCLATIALGPDADFNGCRPFLASDTLEQDVSTWPIDTAATTAMHTLLGTVGFGFDQSMRQNAIDSTKPCANTGQLPVWYPIITDDGDNTEIPLCGNEHLENENPATGHVLFGSWKADGPDYHLFQKDAGTGFIWDLYMMPFVNGAFNGIVNGTYGSAKVFDSRLAFDGQNFPGGDTADAAGLEVQDNILSWGEFSREVAKGLDSNGIAIGYIHHVQRFTQQGFSGAGTFNGKLHGLLQWPATHFANPGGNPATSQNYCGMGCRWRLDPTLNLSSYTVGQQVILRGWQKFGLVAADNGRPGFQVTGDPAWPQSVVGDGGDIDTLKYLHFSSFQVLQATGKGQGTSETADDADGSDALAWWHYIQSCQTPGSNSTTCTYTSDAELVGARPTITSFSASGAGATATASDTTHAGTATLTVPLGTPVTLTLNDTGRLIPNISCAPPFRGNTVTITPTQTTSCTAQPRGPGGIRFGPTINIVLTGPTVATPTITPASGSFSSPQTVTLASATPGASLTYATDGSQANQYSTPYTGPFTQQYSGVISAFAYKSGMLNSGVSSATLTIAGSPAQPGNTNSVSSSSAAETSLTTTVTNTVNGSFVLLSVYQYDNTNQPTACVSSSGNTATTIKVQGDGGAVHNSYNISAYAIANEPAGTSTITCTWPAGAPAVGPTLNVASFSGAATTSPVEGAVSASGTGTITCGTVTTTGPNEQLVQMGEVGYGNTAAASSGTWKPIAATHIQTFYQLQASPGSYALTQSANQSGTQTCVAFAIRHP